MIGRPNVKTIQPFLTTDEPRGLRIAELTNRIVQVAWYHDDVGIARNVAPDRGHRMTTRVALERSGQVPGEEQQP